LRGGWWFGDGNGSNIGESFYTLACDVNHAGAQQSFESFAERPGVLWEENIRTPERLHVGSRFTWKGVFVTVTSMRKDSLVACTYKNIERVEDLKPGAIIGYNPGHLVLSAKRNGKKTVLKVVETSDRPCGTIIDKRFTITYEEITDLRKTAKARVRAIVTKITQCNPDRDRARITKEINAEHFRHFELEEIQSAFRRRERWLSSEIEIEKWRQGNGGAWLDVKLTLLRLCDGRVECSNGNSVSEAAASRVVPVLLEHRKKSGELSIAVDGYQVKRVSKDGVKIGCTLVPWEEIDRIAPQLEP
jgi:hypothetical protein